MLVSAMPLVRAAAERAWNCEYHAGLGLYLALRVFTLLGGNLTASLKFETIEMSEDSALYLLCYDIVDQRRRYRLDKLLKGYGQRVQRSVFECELDTEQLQALKAALLKRIDANEDRVHIYRLCGKDNRGVKTFGLAQRAIHPDHYIV